MDSLKTAAELAAPESENADSEIVDLEVKHLVKMCEELDEKYAGSSTWYNTNPMKDSLDRILAFCVPRNINPRIYLEAQFNALKNVIKRPGMRMFPNMLVGQNSQRRYNEYIDKQRKYRGTASAPIDTKRDWVFEAETMFGQAYIISNLYGMRTTVGDAARRVCEDYPEYSLKTPGRGRVKAAALCLVLDQLQSDLSSYVVLRGTRWSWRGVLEFLVTLYGGEHAEKEG